MMWRFSLYKLTQTIFFDGCEDYMTPPHLLINFSSNSHDNFITLMIRKINNSLISMYVVCNMYWLACYSYKLKTQKKIIEIDWHLLFYTCVKSFFSSFCFETAERKHIFLYIHTHTKVNVYGIIISSYIQDAHNFSSFLVRICTIFL